MILEFERPFVQIQEQIVSLKNLLETMSEGAQSRMRTEIKKLETKAERTLFTLYNTLTPWQKVLVARHPERPKTQDYIQKIIDHFVPLAGDRCFADDKAILSGLGMFRGIPVLVLGHEKGYDTETRLEHNFGMAHPEGYRKVCRLMELADRLHIPILTFVDTPGAYAGMQAEERGQSQAIAECINQSLKVNVPILSVIIGEGGSGGAVALATSNFITMLEHSVYSVISPEGCASILWRTSDKKEDAAAAQKLTAQDLLKFSIIDTIIAEPLGGAHRNKLAIIDHVSDALYGQLKQCQKIYKSEKAYSFSASRREKFLRMGSIPGLIEK